MLPVAPTSLYMIRYPPAAIVALNAANSFDCAGPLSTMPGAGVSIGWGLAGGVASVLVAGDRRSKPVVSAATVKPATSTPPSAPRPLRWRRDGSDSASSSQ